MLRAHLIRLGRDNHRLLLAVHHIAFDGWSLSVLIDELTRAYASLSAGRAPDLPPLSVQYADFALWQRDRLRGQQLDELVDYWRTELSGAPDTLDLLTDSPRPAVLSLRGAKLSRELSEGLTRSVSETARRLDLTPFMG